MPDYKIIENVEEKRPGELKMAEGIIDKQNK